MAVSYEKGEPKNLVCFSEYNDLAFSDTGVKLNDNSKPDRNTIWSSDRINRQIERRLAEMAPNTNIVANRDTIQVEGPNGSGIYYRSPRDAADMGGNGRYRRSPEYYPNGYRRYWNRGDHTRHHFFRVLRPSWWLSFVIPTRQHYCDKCCNYLEHTWSTVWNDDPSLANNSCSAKCAGKPLAQMFAP